MIATGPFPPILNKIESNGQGGRLFGVNFTTGRQKVQWERNILGNVFNRLTGFIRLCQNTLSRPGGTAGLHPILVVKRAKMKKYLDFTYQDKL